MSLPYGTTLIAAFVIGLIFLSCLIYAVVIFNELVRVRNETDRAWSDIDVLLKQRHDQIPNLVAACQGYMQYERQTLTEPRRRALRTPAPLRCPKKPRPPQSLPAR